MSTCAPGNPPSIPFRGRYEHTRAERIADGVVHAIGITAALSLGAVLLTFAAFQASPGEYAAAILFVICLLTVLSVSLAYNLWPISPTKWVLRRIDHAGIYLLIAATYMPFLAQLDDSSLALQMGILIWGAAAMGIVVKLFLPGRFDRLSIAFYMAIGWSGVLVAKSVVNALPASTLWLLLGGGLAYSAGVIFFLWDRLRFQSATWHGFVVLGGGMHLAAVMDCLVVARA
jgi:hemolysin III